jgi:hypothetical protein
MTSATKKAISRFDHGKCGGWSFIRKGPWPRSRRIMRGATASRWGHSAGVGTGGPTSACVKPTPVDSGATSMYVVAVSTDPQQDCCTTAVVYVSQQHARARRANKPAPRLALWQRPKADASEANRATASNANPSLRMVHSSKGRGRNEGGNLATLQRACNPRPNRNMRKFGELCRKANFRDLSLSVGRALTQGQ